MGTPVDDGMMMSGGAGTDSEQAMPCGCGLRAFRFAPKALKTLHACPHVAGTPDDDVMKMSSDAAMERE